MYVIKVRNFKEVIFETFQFSNFNDFASKYMELLETGHTMYFFVSRL